MAVVSTIKGIDEVVLRFQEEMRLLQKKAANGLRRSGTAVIKATRPLTPVDTGLLKSSFLKKFHKKGDTMWLDIINPVSYAIYVHEIIENRHPVGEAKFLFKGALTSSNAIMSIMQSAMKI